MASLHKAQDDHAAAQEEQSYGYEPDVGIAAALTLSIGCWFCGLFKFLYINIQFHVFLITFLFLFLTFIYVK